LGLGEFLEEGFSFHAVEFMPLGGDSQDSNFQKSSALRVLRYGFLGRFYQSVGWTDTDKHGRTRTEW